MIKTITGRIRGSLLLLLLTLLSGCLFKFNGTDTLYYEGKKAKPTLTIKRVWCSQCGCEALEIKEMKNGNAINEMLLNCTEGCPPGDRSYKIKRDYVLNIPISTKYYFLVGDKYSNISKPLSVHDSLLIQKLRQFQNEPFFQHYCLDILTKFKGYLTTDSSQIIRFPGK